MSPAKRILGRMSMEECIAASERPEIQARLRRLRRLYRECDRREDRRGYMTELRLRSICSRIEFSLGPDWHWVYVAWSNREAVLSR